MSDNWVSFPNLGLEFNVGPVAFTLFDIEVKWKWIFALFAAAIALVMFVDYAKVNKLGAKKTRVSFAVGGFFGLLGARLLGTAVIEMMYRYYMYQETYHYDTYYYGADGWKFFFRLDDGSMTIFGGFILGALALLAMCKIANKVGRSDGWRFADVADSAVMALPLAQGIFALNNIFSQTRYGHNTDSLFAIDGNIIQADVLQRHLSSDATVGQYVEWIVGKPVTANFLFDFIGCIAVYFLLKHFPKKWILFRGQVAMLYLAMYGVVRAFSEIGIAEGMVIYRFNLDQGLAVMCAVVFTLLIVIFCIKCRGGGLKKISLYVDKRTNDGFEDTEMWQREYTAEQVEDETAEETSAPPTEYTADGGQTDTAEPQAEPERDEDFVQTDGDGTVWSADEEENEKKEDENGDNN